jgi:hypothetical protein
MDKEDMENNEIPSKTEKVEIRNPDGTFAPGNKIALGNVRPDIKIRRDFTGLLFDSITEEDYRNCVKKLKELCNSNDKKTAIAGLKLFLDFTTQKPKQEISAKIENALSKEEQVEVIREQIRKNLGV